jgi:hypothetical protein
MESTLETTIVIGTGGQLVVTVPKQVAKLFGVGSGTKVNWSYNQQERKMIGEVKI